MTSARLLLAVLLVVSCVATVAQADQLVWTGPIGGPTLVGGEYTYSYQINDWVYDTSRDPYTPAGGPSVNSTQLWAIDVGSTTGDITAVLPSTGWSDALLPSFGGSIPGLAALTNSNVILFYWDGSYTNPEVSSGTPTFSFESPRGPVQNYFALTDGASNTPINDGHIYAPESVPEPGSLALGSVLLLGLGGWRVRRGKRSR